MNRIALMCAALALGAPACQREELTGPPTLHLGRDECALCGMIINEERFSSALLVAEAGSPRHLVFDDVGCMLDYRAEHPDLMVMEGFVHDYGTRRWLGAGQARYVMASPGTVATPMGSGIAAFAAPGAAAERARAWGVGVLDQDGLAKARREWKGARASSGAS